MMASSFPSSIDAFPDPLANSPLDSPSHSGLHQDVNDAVEKIEMKLGVGSSPASGASANQVLKADGAGTSAWSDIVVGDIDATGQPINSVIVADGAGNAAWSGGVGLWLVKTQTIGSGVTTVTVTDTFSSSYDNYRLMISGMNTSSNGTGIKLLLSGVTGNAYFSYSSWQTWGSSAPSGQGYALSNSGYFIGYSGIVADTFCAIDISNPNRNNRTMINFQNVSSSYQSTGGGLCDSTVQSTGFTLDLDGAATMTGGTIRVYGYRN